MTLPKDLAAYRTKQILKRVIPCLLLLGILAAILILWGNSIFSIENKIAQGSCFIIVMLIPFAVTGVPFKLIDSTCYGVVKKVTMETTTDSQSSAKPALEQLYIKNTIYLSIEKPNGKRVHKKVYSGKASLQQNLNTYHEGDTVFHLYGTNTVIVLPTKSSLNLPCAVCGSTNEIQNDQCRHCGHSLIKSI